MWFKYLCDIIRSHKLCPTLMDSCCSRRWVLSSLLLFGLMENNMLVRQPCQYFIINVTKAWTSSLLTLWMLQPMTIHIVKVTALKLLLTVVGHRHWDEWIHAIKPFLRSTNSGFNYKTSNLLSSGVWNIYHDAQLFNKITKYVSFAASETRNMLTSSEEHHRPW